MGSEMCIRDRDKCAFFCLIGAVCDTELQALSFFTVDAGGAVRVKQEPGSRSTGEPPTKKLKVEGDHTTMVSKPEISRSDWILN